MKGYSQVGPRTVFLPFARETTQMGSNALFTL
jgi:hypothetical protein